MAPPQRPDRFGYEGLSKVAHAIRRSAALFVAAAYVVPPDASIEDLKDQAEDLAKWIGGKAAEAEAEQDGRPSGSPLGQQWPPVD